MRIIFCVCSIALLSNICIADDYSDSPTIYKGNENNASPSEPTVYADISQGVIDKAASPNGTYALLGLGFGSQIYSASIKDNSNFTKNDISMFSVIAGVGYNKSLKYNIVVGIDATIGLSPKKKKNGDWNSLNSAYNASINDAEVPGVRSGKLETDMMNPAVGITCGYFFKKQKAVIFGIVGVSMLTGTYDYYLGTNKNANIRIRSFVPSVGLGAEMKFDKKWGLRIEYNRSLNRIVTKNVDQYEHKINIRKSNIRIMGTYNLSGSQGFARGN